MKLEKLAVKNFRTLEDIQVTFAGYYTAISGQNNAGKTSLIRAIRHTFRDNSKELFFMHRRDEISHGDDRTHWVKGDQEIVFEYDTSVSSKDDPGLFQFIEKFNEEKLKAETARVRIRVCYKANEANQSLVWVNDKELSTYASKEVLQKLRSSTLAFMHDSSRHHASNFGFGGRELHELMFTSDEIKQIGDEARKVQRKIKGISKAHRAELTQLLGHLEEKYEVDFAIPEGVFTGSVPFAVNLRDKNVDIPLSDWGSGTRNRTEIMMSILQANRIRSKPDENKITPFIIIEEPESFLHPSAQAEFGRVLMDLANELQIQTIVTTHSPYMLCQRSVASNILLGRKLAYGKLKHAEVIEVDEANWMEPFSSILGLKNTEFEAWKDVLFSANHCVLLVEGAIDKAYFEHINSLRLPNLTLPSGVDIVPYEGKDALKNTILLKFILAKFKRVLVTFDLDARAELEKVMRQLDLVEGTGFLVIGQGKPGRECIEGLVPERVLSKVHGQNTDLVMQLSAADASARRSAKNSLKQKVLAEFKADSNITKDDLKGFLPVFRALERIVK